MSSTSGENWDADGVAWGRMDIEEHHGRYFIEGSQLDEWMITDTMWEVER